MEICKYFLGIHVDHDRSVAVVKNGILIAHVAEERLDRIKHSSSDALPLKSINAVLKYLNIQGTDIFSAGISFASSHIDNTFSDFAAEIKSALNNPSLIVVPVKHHLAHAYSAFCTCALVDPVIFVADGAGDFANNDSLEAETAFVGRDNQLTSIWSRTQGVPTFSDACRAFFRLNYLPNRDFGKKISIGRKYEQVTYMLGFDFGQCGKTMGLSSYGTPIPDLISGLPRQDIEDLRIEDFIDRIEVLRNKSGLTYDFFIKRYSSDIAASIQHLAQEYIIKMLNDIYEIYPTSNLCLAGGVFLNCVLNNEIKLKTPFKNIHILPAPGDEGQSIGAAFFAYKTIANKIPRMDYFSPYQGLEYKDCEIHNELSSTSLKWKNLSESDLIEEICSRISAGEVCGMFRGRSEIGPRALGHRSIFANPTRSEIKNHLNKYVKYRELFRPFAPIVTEDEAPNYFDITKSSKYMLFSVLVKNQYRSLLPAITHVDGSARIQTVDASDDEFIHSLLICFKKHSGFPILLNTSFNLAGEPIVESPRDAIKTFIKSNIDFLIIENYLIEK